MSAREVIARALRDIRVRSHASYIDEAEHILASLSVAGLAVLPVEQADTRAADLARTRALLKGSGEMGGTRHAAAQEGDK